MARLAYLSTSFYVNYTSGGQLDNIRATLPYVRKFAEYDLPRPKSMKNTRINYGNRHHTSGDGQIQASEVPASRDVLGSIANGMNHILEAMC